MTASRPAASLPHTGIATFCKAPYVFDPAEIDADIAILGVPFDGMASMRPGCRQAPRALRDASTRFGWLGESTGTKGFFDIEAGHTFLAGDRSVDAGDVDVSLDEGVTRARITQHASKIVERGALLASIGGDHSVSFPLIAALKGMRLSQSCCLTHTSTIATGSWVWNIRTIVRSTGLASCLS